MLKEVKALKRYLKCSCKSKINNEINVFFHAHVSGQGKGVRYLLEKE